MPPLPQPPAMQPGDRAIAALAVNVAALMQEPIGAIREYRVEAAPFSLDGSETPFDGRLRLLRTDRTIMATARLAATAEDVCGGCLEPIRVPLRVEFDEEYWPGHDPADGRAIEIPPEREGFPIVDSEIDLTEAVRQYAVMARPMSPRCGDRCPGVGAAGSEPGIDGRWAALAAVRGELDD